jgi:hypothetical protein
MTTKSEKRDVAAEKEKFLCAIANAGCFSDAIADLMKTSSRDHFEFTVDGAIKCAGVECSSEEGAFLWMQCHYDSISASTNAAGKLAEALSQSLDELYNTARELLKANEAA